ncbi:GIY-YIG nuclease family protein [Streptomyces sp. NPDC059928]|uniref:GIY-YIG nuclease family protein n=1 Tax=unclassified Streptomyces TaxID=2593676 RepID=UPI00364EF71E
MVLKQANGQTARPPTGVDGAGVTALYRLYDSDDRLLYIGVTKNPPRRFAAHRSDKPWWPNVARREVSWWPTRYEAGRAESAAIWNESPLYNQAGTPADNAKRSARQQANLEQARIKGKVSFRANLLRRKVKARLVRAGMTETAARRAGLMAERAYKEASGAFPDGVTYPPLSWL